MAQFNGMSQTAFVQGSTTYVTIPFYPDTQMNEKYMTQYGTTFSGLIWPMMFAEPLNIAVSVPEFDQQTIARASFNSFPSIE